MYIQYIQQLQQIQSCVSTTYCYHLINPCRYKQTLTQMFNCSAHITWELILGSYLQKINTAEASRIPPSWEQPCT
jgi:hypothetical protein